MRVKPPRDSYGLRASDWPFSVETMFAFPVFAWPFSVETMFVFPVFACQPADGTHKSRSFSFARQCSLFHSWLELSCYAGTTHLCWKKCWADLVSECSIVCFAVFDMSVVDRPLYHLLSQNLLLPIPALCPPWASDWPFSVETMFAFPVFAWPFSVETMFVFPVFACQPADDTHKSRSFSFARQCSLFHSWLELSCYAGTTHLCWKKCWADLVSECSIYIYIYCIYIYIVYIYIVYIYCIYIYIYILYIYMYVFYITYINIYVYFTIYIYT